MLSACLDNDERGTIEVLGKVKKIEKCGGECQVVSWKISRIEEQMFLRMWILKETKANNSVFILNAVICWFLIQYNFWFLFSLFNTTALSYY